jgi:solute carrier family 9 (sodium/hydrogen exchanger), member 6/7
MSGGSIETPLMTAFFFILLLLYVVLGGYMEHKHAKFGHETGVALVAGLIISSCLHFFVEGKMDLSFDGTIFFYVCLPPIIFASGFNMRRRRFFANIGYILMFGIVGTILTFLVFSALTYTIMNYTTVDYYVKHPTEGMDNWQVLVLNPIECFVISSLLCSSDVIAAISIVKYEE